MNYFAPKLSIAVLAALVVFISVKLLKLYFTFPLIAIGALGIFLLLRKRKTLWHIEKEDGSRRVNIFVQTSGYLFMLLSIFTLFIGLAMTVVNIIYGLISRVEPNQAKKSLSNHQESWLLPDREL